MIHEELYGTNTFLSLGQRSLLNGISILEEQAIKKAKKIANGEIPESTERSLTEILTEMELMTHKFVHSKNLKQ